MNLVFHISEDGSEMTLCYKVIIITQLISLQISCAHLKEGRKPLKLHVPNQQ